MKETPLVLSVLFAWCPIISVANERLFSGPSHATMWSAGQVWPLSPYGVSAQRFTRGAPGCTTCLLCISYTVPPDLHRWSASLWQVLRIVFGTGMVGEKVAHSDEELVEGQLSFARWYASGLANCMNRLGQ